MGPENPAHGAADVQLPKDRLPRNEPADLASVRDKIAADLRLSVGKPADGKPAGPADTRSRLDAELPIPGTARAAYERSPVRGLEQKMEQHGMTSGQIGELRQALRDNPQLCDKLGGTKPGAELLRDFSQVGEVPYRRFVAPDTGTDQAIHKALGKPAGEYVSQHELDDLTQTAAARKGELLEKGLSEGDVEAVRRYLVRDTGRVPGTETPNPVMTSDGHQSPNADAATLHDMERWQAIIRSAPITTYMERVTGKDLEHAEHFAEMVNDLHEAAAQATEAHAKNQEHRP